MKKEIPQEVKGAVMDGLEEVVFPKPAKTTGGRILRFLYKIAKIFVSGKKINL